MTFDASEQKPVGTRGAVVSRLGIGTSAFGTLQAIGGEAIVSETMRAAEAAKLRYFDSAPFYGSGLAELRLGQALHATSRDDVTISTKVGRLFHADLSRPHEG